MSYKTGVCWASNQYLDGTKTGRSASRFIAELKKSGYIRIEEGDGKLRKIYICPIDSKVGDVNHPAVQFWSNPNAPARLLYDKPNLANSGDDTETTSPKIAATSPTLVDNLANSGDPTSPNLATEHLNITNLNKQIKNKQTDCSFSETKPIERQEDATALFQKCREYWNERNLKPQCRHIVIPHDVLSPILTTFQHYSWAEIRNAIGNYAWHKQRAGNKYVDPPPYGSLYGFLKTGVERYFDDNALDQQFKKEIRK